MEAEPGAERRHRTRRVSTDEEKDRDRDRDTIVIRFPDIDPELRQWFRDMMPGRALFRVLRELPDEFVEHSRNARRERLLAVRSLVDALIEDAEQPRPSRRRSREIEID
ncbi:MAG: hypothetical protein QOF51_248 [Chloroflexota bacterium]|jgi:hypothetical protein|nr:hypothetical protein [Chloroflexota bacterium]